MKLYLLVGFLTAFTLGSCGHSHEGHDQMAITTKQKNIITKVIIMRVITMITTVIVTKVLKPVTLTKSSLLPKRLRLQE